MAFQCDDEMESKLELNPYKVDVTPNSPLSLNDTIWIRGRVTSRVYDLSINDSIFNEDPYIIGNQFSIFKFMEPTENANCKDAIDKFELIFDIGEYSFLSSCKNAQITVIPELDTNGSFYTYRIGLKPLTIGDYIIFWNDVNSAEIQNENRNEFIAENYPLENRPNQIGFDKCGNLSWLFLDETERVYFFSIE